MMLAFSLSKLLCIVDHVYSVFVLPCARFSLIGWFLEYSVIFLCFLLRHPLDPVEVVLLRPFAWAIGGHSPSMSLVVMFGQDGAIPHNFLGGRYANA